MAEIEFTPGDIFEYKRDGGSYFGVVITGGACVTIDTCGEGCMLYRNPTTPTGAVPVLDIKNRGLKQKRVLCGLIAIQMAFDKGDSTVQI